MTTDAEFRDIVVERLTEIRNLLALAVSEPEPQEPGPCEHPEDQRTDRSTMTKAGFYCRACQTMCVVDRRTGEPIEV